MDAIQALHNAARHYCIEQADRRRRQCAELTAAGRDGTAGPAEDGDYPAEAHDLVHRWPCSTRSGMTWSGSSRATSAPWTNSNRRCSPPAKRPSSRPALDRPGSARAVEDERRRFANSSGPPTSTASQPCRRAVPASAGRGRTPLLHAAFFDRWGVWYGGSVDPAEKEAGTVTLHVNVMEDPGAYDRLRRLLAGHGGTRLFELREWGEGYVLDVAAASFSYNGAEGSGRRPTWNGWSTRRTSGRSLLAVLGWSMACGGSYPYSTSTSTAAGTQRRTRAAVGTAMKALVRKKPGRFPIALMQIRTPLELPRGPSEFLSEGVCRRAVGPGARRRPNSG